MEKPGVGELLGIVAVMVACQSAPASKQAGIGGSTAQTGTTDVQSGNGGSTNGSSALNDVGGTGATLTVSGGSDAAGNGSSTSAAGTAGAGVGGAPTVSTKMSLTKASARIGGRIGDTLIITIEGKAPIGMIGSIEVGLFDGADNGIKFFDGDWDGTLESNVGRVQPTKPPATETFTIESNIAGTKRLTDLSKLQVALFDRENGRTEPVTVNVQPQPVVELGGACDPKYVTNRCREGLSCSGSPAVCVAGTAPTIAHAAFQRGSDGPFIRVDGVDPDEDVILMRVDFLTSSDAPISLDLDGDEVPDADHLEVDSGITNQNGGYIFVVESGQGFESLVPRLGLTAIDSKGNRSSRQVASISTRTTRSSGQTCDISGFVGCVAGTTCLPGSNNVAYCNTYTQAETARCAAAPVWDLAKDPAKITGLISGYSAWEAPAGCLSSTSTHRPEFVVKLRLAKATPKLILSTAEPETGIDTGLVVLPTCTADPAVALACNDDSTGYTSSVTLADLAAGDYFVIVEAVQADGGGFGLSAKTQ